MIVRALMTLLLLLAAAACQPADREAAETERSRGDGGEVATARAPASELEDEVVPHPLAKVVVIGASASSGFGTTIVYEHATGRRSAAVDFGQIVDAMIARDHRPVEAKADFMFFDAPLERGPRFVAFAIERDPTLVVAVDFLFWYGYGARGADGGPLGSEDDRLTLLDVGLDLLDRFSCPVVVGDFPDMSPAVGKLLSARQMPSPEALAKLNGRVRDWAAERSNVILLPFAKLVDDIRAGRDVRIGEHVWGGRIPELLQLDDLHPTLHGLVAIAQLVAMAVEERVRGVSGYDLVTDPDAILDRLRTRLSAP